MQLWRLTTAASLRKLFLSECRRLTRLDGIEDLPLEDVEINYVPKLERIAAMPMGRLRRFKLASAKKVDDLDSLQGARIEDLWLADVLPIESFELFGGLRELRSLGWVGPIAGPASLSPRGPAAPGLVVHP